MQKNVFKIFFLVVVILTRISGVYSQTVENGTRKTIDKQAELNPSEAKLNFINGQNYLSKNALVDYNAFYGDSLKGFDEDKAKAELFNHGVYGEEYIGYVKILKRNYIKNKYKIGLDLPFSNTTNSGGTNSSYVPLSSKNIGNTAIVNVAPCVNEDFEATTPGVYTTSNAVTGWTVSNRLVQVCNPTNAWLPGSNEFSIVSTPIVAFPIIGTIPNSPLGGTRVARLNNSTANAYSTRIAQTFPVTSANTLFQFAYAGLWQDGFHNCCEQPLLKIQLYSCSNAPLACSSLSLNAAGSNCPTGATGYTVVNGQYSWTNWTVKFIDLTPYIGSCVTIEVINSDCIYGGHYGTVFFDARCGGQLVGAGLSGVGGSIAGPVSFCAGSGIAQISAPLGYATYSWVAPASLPPIPASQATLATLTVTNPVPNSVYTVNLTSPSGCQFVATNTIATTTVVIAGVGTTTTCPNGASGSATVQGNGSASGYNYLWQSSTGATVGTNSVVTGLAAGIYSISISGLGASGCGSAATTVTVTTGPPGLISLTKPFCGNIAYLNTAGGSNFQWYNGSSIITGTAGTASGYTVNSPYTGQIINLSYFSSFGCQDSVQFTLYSSPPGAMNVASVGVVCQGGGNNGTAVVTMTPALGSPPGICTILAFNANTLTPPYNYSLGPVSNTVFPLTGLSAGTYSVKTFDGSCFYNTTFNVQAYNFNFTLTPGSATTCPNNTLLANATFSVPIAAGEYNFSWSPATWIAGGNTTLQNNFILPTVSIGSSSTIVYTVVATPTIANCPLSKTIAVTAINPPTPTINPIPNMCDNGALFSTTVNPPGGTFISSGTSSIAPIGVTSGIINPSISLNGLNTFTYSILVNTCVATQTANFQVSHFNPATLTSSVPPLCVTNGAFNLNNIVLFTATGTWTGTGVAGTSFVPTNVPFAPNSLLSVSTLTYFTVSTPNATVCPDNSTLSVSVTKTLTPVITPVAPFCTNASPFSLTVSPAGGIWGGNPAISSVGVFSPAISSPSLAGVIYTLTNGPCVNIASSQLNISTFNTAAFSSTIPNLCGTGAPFNLMSIVQSTVNGVWFSPQGVSSNSFFPGGMVTNTYALTYTTSSSPNATLCPDSKTIAVSVLNPPIPIISQVDPLCSKDAALQLTVTPNIGNWVASGYLTPGGVLIPSLCVTGNNPVQYVIGTSTCNSQQTKYINVEAFASAALTSSIPDQCNSGTPLNLLPITQSNQGIWSGPGISGTSFNPGTAGAGHFVLTYNTASSPSGLCPDQSTVAVTVYSLAAPAITKIKRLCNNAEPVQLQVSPVGGLFGGANNFAVSSKGLFNPAIGVIGDNIINYSITSGPCVAYGQTTVTIEKFVSAGFTGFPKAVYCQTIDQPINLNSFATNPGGTWTGAGVSPGSSMFDPNMVAVGTNSVFYKTHSMPTPSLCPDENVLTLNVAKPTEVSPRTNPAVACVPFEAILNVPGVDDGTATWIFGDGSDSKQELTTSHVYKTPGHYTATLVYVNKEGCPSAPVVAATYTVNELPAPDFVVPEEVFISDPVVQFTNLTPSINSNKYYWKVEGIQKSNEVNPSLPFPEIGRYNVTLLAENPNTTCKAEITKPLDVKNDFNVFIPSSFSPNFDGLNDIFVPVFSAYGLDAKSYEMEVFDRWGHSVFRTKEVVKGWDGSVFNKGEPLKEDVYVYKIKYKDLDGKLYNKIGHVSLIK